MDDLRIDSHKLLFHPRRVADWLDGIPIAPIYFEISPSSLCNHNCRFCGLDYLRTIKRQLPESVLNSQFPEMAEAGVKAVMFAGEGEPFIHPGIVSMATTAKGAGIDVSFTTNGALLTAEKARALLPVTSWIKVSMNAGTAASYAAIHRAPVNDFEAVWRNMETALAIRARSTEGAARCTIGFQIVVLPENRHEITGLARRVREIGGDYLVLKPYSFGPNILHDQYRDLAYGNCDDLEAVRALSTDSFSVIFRGETLSRLERSSYPRCLAQPFWGYIDSTAHWWGCMRHVGEDAFSFGSLAENSFREILDSAAYREKIRTVRERYDVSECHRGCRMDAVNTYLQSLLHPSPHVNFI
jgi:Predicted Fe-S oxidoreductases